jgi:anti-sigma B factor antagonist
MVLEEGDTPLNRCVEALVDTGRVKLVLDMHEVTYVDSAGLGTMVANYVRVHRRGGDIKLVHPTPRSAQVLGITRLNRVFQIFEEEANAVRSFGLPADPGR